MKQDTTTRFYVLLNQPAIPVLNGVRALAVILVILHHLGFVTYDPGNLGVISFFVLSGFLITWLLLREHEETGEISLRSFYIRRALRLLPAFYAFGFVYIGLATLSHRLDGWDQYFAALLYFNDYYRWIHPAAHIPLDHTWSLAVEEQFYLIWPLICVWCACDRRKLIAGLCSAIILVSVGRVIYQFWFAADPNVVYYSFHTRADSLAIGCLLAVLFKSGKHYRMLSLIISSSLAPLVTLVVLGISVYILPIYGRPYMQTVGFLLWPVLLAILMVQWIALSPTRLWGWLNAEPLNTMGKWSYAAYLWHWLINYALMNRYTVLPNILRIPVAIILTFAIAGLSWQLVERPFLRFKDRFRPRPGKSPAASVGEHSIPFSV